MGKVNFQKIFLLKLNILLLMFCTLSGTMLFGQENVLHIKNVIRLTLKNNPNIKIAENNSLSSYSLYKSGLSAFDPSLNINANYKRNKNPLQYGLQVIQPEQKTITYNINLVKKFDWGVSLIPNLSIVQNNASLGRSSQKITQSTFNFTIEVPLLRNRGFLGSGAESKAAKLLYDASKKTTKFSVSGEIKNSIDLYLDLIAAEQVADIYKGSEKRAQHFVELTKALIAADKKPARAIDIVQANLADKKRAGISSEQSLYQIKQNLLVQLGSDAKSFDLNIPGNLFPSFAGIEIKIDKNTSIKSALKKRDDLLALQIQTQAKKLLEKSSERNLLNQLDLSMNVGYSGLKTSAQLVDLYNAIYPQNRGMSYSVGINYQLPFGNSAREAELISRKAELDNALVNMGNMKNVIKSQVLTSLNNLRSARLELEQDNISVKLFTTAYEDENIKLEKGLSTFFDVDQTEQKLTNAMLNRINTETNYLKAVINFKYVTGRLINKSGSGSYSVDIADLFKL